MKADQLLIASDVTGKAHLWLCVDYRGTCSSNSLSISLKLFNMGRNRQYEKSRRQRCAARKGRTSVGQPRPSVDWQCPYCAQWFSQKRNGPGNHLRFCAAHRSHQMGSRSSRPNRSAPLAHEEPTATDSSDDTDLLNDGSSSSESDSQSSSNSEVDKPVTHKRRAKKVRSPFVPESRHGESKF